jgi:hypothetical protein
MVRGTVLLGVLLVAIISAWVKHQGNEAEPSTPILLSIDPEEEYRHKVTVKEVIDGQETLHNELMLTMSKTKDEGRYLLAFSGDMHGEGGKVGPMLTNGTRVELIRRRNGIEVSSLSVDLKHLEQGNTDEIQKLLESSLKKALSSEYLTFTQPESLLLPGQRIKAGESWEIKESAASMYCDAVLQHGYATYDQVRDSIASRWKSFKAHGKVMSIEKGQAKFRMEISGLRFITADDPNGVEISVITECAVNIKERRATRTHLYGRMIQKGVNVTYDQVLECLKGEK